MIRRAIRGLQAVARGFAVVQIAVVFGAVYLVLAPLLTLLRAVFRSSTGWRAAAEDASVEDLSHGI